MRCARRQGYWLSVGWAGLIKPNIGDYIETDVGLDKTSPTYELATASDSEPGRQLPAPPWTISEIGDVLIRAFKKVDARIIRGGVDECFKYGKH